jgi:polyisoprenyl-phosphate glycosyltransferase
MDSDGQDCPHAIESMIDYWLNGDDVVYAIRFGRKENLLKRLMFSCFYRMLSAVSTLAIPRNAGNFGLLDCRIVEQIRALRDLSSATVNDSRSL